MCRPVTLRSFSYNQWLTDAKPSVHLQRTMPNTDYNLTVVTACDSARVTAAVHATASSPFGTTEEVQLVNESGDGTNANNITFAPGSVQMFAYKAADIKTPLQLHLRVAPSCADSGPWKIARLILEQGSKSSVFKSEDVVNTTDGEASITFTREVTSTEYTASVMTCDWPEDAGFDGDVLVKLAGSDATTDWIKLVPSSAAPSVAAADNSSGAPAEAIKPYATGAATTCTFTAPNVGSMLSLDIKMEGGQAGWWRCNKISIAKDATGEVAVFRYDAWMSLYTCPITIQPQAVTHYKVIVHATQAAAIGKGGAAAFDGSVEVKLEGYNGGTQYLAVPFEGGLAPGGTATLAGVKFDEGAVMSVQIKASAARRGHTQGAALPLGLCALLKTGPAYSSWGVLLLCV